MSSFFDDVLGFDPNGGGLHDTFLGDILDNPIVSTVLKFTPAAPLAWGWDVGSAAGAGKWGKAALSGLGAYGSLGGFGSGVPTSEAAFAASDAAQLAEQGLSASQISDILGQSYGLDAVTSSMMGQNAFLGMSPQELYQFSNSLGGYGDWGLSAAPYDPSMAASINPQLKLATELSGLGGATSIPFAGMSPALPANSGVLDSLQPPDFGLSNGLKLSTNLSTPGNLLGPGKDLATTLGNLSNYHQLGQTGSTMSGAVQQTPGQAPIEEATSGQQNSNYKPRDASFGSFINTMGDTVNDALVNPIKQGAQGLVSWSGGKLPELSNIFGSKTGDLDLVDLVGAGVKTVGALDIADDLKKQAQLSDVFANQRNFATDKWQNSYTDPEALFQEYMKGPGAKYLKESAARMAQAGNRGQLPTLMTNARQDFYTNYLPQYREQINPKVFNSQPNANLYGAAANAKGTAYSQFPSTLSEIYRRKYGVKG